MFVRPFITIIGLIYLVGLVAGWLGYPVEALDDARRGADNLVTRLALVTGLVLAPIGIVGATRTKQRRRAETRRQVLDWPQAPSYFGPGDVEKARQDQEVAVAIAMSNPVWEICIAAILLLVMLSSL